MLVEVYMPKNGMDMTEGTLVSWLKHEGDHVEKDEPIMEIETDKVTMEAESPAAGILLKQLYPDGSTVPVLTVVGYIGKPGDQIPVSTSQEVAPKHEAVQKTAPEQQEKKNALCENQNGEIAATPYARTLAAAHNINLSMVIPGGRKGEIRGADVERVIANAAKATPLAKAVSKQIGVDISAVPGTGFYNKVTKADVLAFGAQKSPQADVHSTPQATGESKNTTHMTSMRKVIARRMLASHQEIPPVTTCVKVDMTRLLSLREEINHDKEKADRISINDLIVKATSKALLKNQRFRMQIDGDSYVIQDQINIGIAVGMDDGLLVPVIRNTDQKSLSEISHEAKTLAKMAKSGSLKPEYLGNACITISNLGMFGTYCFTPIVNQPEASIIGVCDIEDELALVDGSVMVKKTTILCTTYDHRIINGMEASIFQKDLKDLLENPTEILI